MATSENVIGVVAQFDISQFVKNQAAYSAALNKANAQTQAFYQTQIALTAKAGQNADTNAQRIIAALDAQSKAHQDNADKVKKSSGEGAKTFSENMAIMGLAIKGVEQITGILIGTFQKTFELGKQGAIINQINASFQHLIGTEAQAADMEHRLSDAVRGTLTGEQLRVAVIKMMTGAEGEFADRVKEAAPALFEMAAAANKLNPTLGGTKTILEAMSQSLEMGTTRSLKRLGIIIDQTKAEEIYAKSIGITAAELDEEQKKVAVLNAALEYHDTLLRQVGGDVSSQVDPYTRLSVAIEETGEKLKKALAPALADAAEVLALLLTAEDKLNAAHAKHNKEIVTTTETYTDYIAEIQRSYTATFQIINAQGELETAYTDSFSGLSQITYQQVALTEAEWESTRATQAATEAIKDYTNKGASMMLVTAGMALTGKALAEAQKGVEDALKAAQKGIQDYADKTADLQIKAGESILSAEKDFQDKSAKTWQDYIQKTSDIIAEGIQARAKIQQTYNDKITSAERDYQRGAEDLNYSHGQRMADIERNYQDTIRNIQQTYQEDSLDAVRNLDAIGLIRAREKRDKDLAAAAQDRDRASSAEQENYGRALYELMRALADKRDEAERSRERELDEQRRTERDKLDAAKRAYNDQQTEAQNAFDARIAAINAQYNQEDIAAQAHYLNQQTLLRQHLEAMRAIMAAYGMGVGGDGGGVHGRAEGGIDIVNTPTQFLAGEAGTEIVYTAPLNRALPSPIMQTISHTGDFSHSINAAINSSVAGLDGRIVAAVVKAISQIIR